jgi:hypothetical protein
VIGELNKIFDRDFVVGHFTPALLFIAATLGVFGRFDALPAWLNLDGQELLKDTTVFALLALAVAICLQTFNSEVVRFMEGYWLVDVSPNFAYFQLRKFRALQDELDKVNDERQRCLAASEPFQRPTTRRNLMRRAAKRFPSKERQVLPTAIGNTIRAYEDYPRVMYGFESIQGWSRLHAVISKEYLESVRGARAMMDFWVNLFALSLVVLGGYFVAAWAQSALDQWRQVDFYWIPAVCLWCAWFFSYRARTAAERWGEWVKASFDAFLPELAKKLGYSLPPSGSERRGFWRKFSQAMIYRSDYALDELDAYRDKPAPSTPLEVTLRRAALTDGAAKPAAQPRN